MEARISINGDVRIQMRRNMRMGAKKGIIDRTTDNVPSGLFMMNMMRRSGTTRSMVTGMARF